MNFSLNFKFGLSLLILLQFFNIGCGRNFRAIKGELNLGALNVQTPVPELPVPNVKVNNLGWVSTGSTSEVIRSSTTAVLLTNGKVLLLGGWNAISELYSPEFGTWNSTGALNIPRFTKSATLLKNGKVIVTGGQNQEVFMKECEIYDTSTGTWSLTTSMNSARSYHTTTLLPNGKVLVTGGLGTGFQALNSGEIYDPINKTWTVIPVMNEARNSHTATLMNNGKVLIVGGYNGSISTNTSEIYDPNTNSWSIGPTLSSSRQLHTATLLGNGKVLIVGGENNPSVGIIETNSSEIYDPISGQWSNATPMSNARSHHSATLLSNGKVLVAGGHYGYSATDSNSGYVIGSSEIYDPIAGSWTENLPMTEHRQDHSATLLQNGSLLVIGGIHPSTGLYRSCELFN
jgi:N-acetylneuraminic acid mutarotase